MLEMLETFAPYSGLLLSAITALLSLILYGRVNSSVIKTLKEELDLISARKLSDASAAISDVSQTFSETKPSYMLNEQTGELEQLPTDENIQEKIQSYITTALSSVLDKYLPLMNPVVEEDEIADYSAMRTDLSEIGAALDLAEDYRARLGLSDTLTAQQIFDEVQKRADALGIKIKEKGVKPDASKSSSEPESEHE